MSHPGGVPQATPAQVALVDLAPRVRPVRAAAQILQRRAAELDRRHARTDADVSRELAGELHDLAAWIERRCAP